MTVFFTLNKGCSCSLDSINSLFLCVWLCVVRSSFLVWRVWNAMDGKHFGGTQSLIVFRFSCNRWVVTFKFYFALMSSWHRSFRWNSWTNLLSKHPLVGILNFKNRGIKSDRLQFSRNLMRRLLVSTLQTAFWWCRNCLQQLLRLSSVAKRRCVRNIVATSNKYICKANNAWCMCFILYSWIFSLFLTSSSDLLQIENYKQIIMINIMNKYLVNQLDEQVFGGKLTLTTTR